MPDTAPDAATHGQAQAGRSAPAWATGGPSASEARSSRFMVASSHPAVSATGASVLERGGTAGDAAVAMAAMCFVALPGMCGPGGDAFCVSYDADAGSYRSIQGSGTGPDGADIDFYRLRGLSRIPTGGALSVAVPGAMAAIAALHAAACTRPLPELWAPAAAAARDGLPATEGLVDDIGDALDKLRADAHAAPVYLPAGAPPPVGSVFRQRDLGATIETLADEPSSLYVGELGRRCVDALTAAGAPFSGREWASTTAETTATITGTYRGLVVHENRPPSQGYMVLQQLGILDGVLSELPWLGGRALVWLARASALAFADRRRVAGSGSDAWQELLSAASLGRAREALREGRLPSGGGAFEGADTTSVVAVDGAGNVVSFIHSLAYAFGSGFMVPGTGVVLNDRLGRGAYLRPGHANSLQPGRKPMHTLNAWIVEGPSGRPVFVGNTPGGDGQVQWNVQVLSHLLDHGSGPARAAEAPRLTLFPGSDADAIGSPQEVRCESRFAPEALDELRRSGADVTVLGPWEAGGSVQVVALDPSTGALHGGSDPRGGGTAQGG